MRPLLVFLLVAAIGQAAYHVGQKSVPPGTNPMVVLVGVYAVALVLCALAAPAFQGSGGGPWLRQLANWPVLLLGLSVTLIEVGYLLAYRTGGSIQWSGVAVAGTSAVLLLPVALWVFREGFGPARAAGLVLTLAGLALLTRR